MSNFGDLYSDCYNLLYADKDYGGEANYIASLIEKYSPQAKSILNLGCGTGNHDFELCKKGYLMHGIDLSANMIAKAKNRAFEYGYSDKIKFETGDIRSVRTGKKYDIVLSLFHVMSYQVTNSDIERAFISANEHLNDNGVFIFDCWYGPAVLADNPQKREKFVENEKIKVLRLTIPVLKLSENIVDVNFKILVTDKRSNEEQNFKELHSMRYLFDNEIDSLAQKSNFSKVSSYKWLTLDSPSEKSWYVVYILKKNIK